MCLCVYVLHLYVCVSAAVWSPSISVSLLVFLSQTQIVRPVVVINQILALGIQYFPTNLSVVLILQTLSIVLDYTLDVRLRDESDLYCLTLDLLNRGTQQVISPPCGDGCSLLAVAVALHDQCGRSTAGSSWITWVLHQMLSRPRTCGNRTGPNPDQTDVDLNLHGSWVGSRVLRFRWTHEDVYCYSTLLFFQPIQIASNGQY